jgi:hypothetical protein
LPTRQDSDDVATARQPLRDSALAASIPSCKQIAQASLLINAVAPQKHTEGRTGSNHP